MKPLAEEIFLQKIGSQIVGARRAIDRLRQATRDGNAEEAYHNVADFLNHVAIVSKILRPSKQVGSQASLRGQYLCEVLRVEESEPALDRRLRNHLEHIDERLDNWISNNKSGAYMDKGLLPITILFGDVSVEPIRHLDVTTGIYIFLGEKFDLAAIETSLDRIFAAATARSELVKVPSQGRDVLREQSQQHSNRSE